MSEYPTKFRKFKPGIGVFDNTRNGNSICENTLHAERNRLENDYYKKTGRTLNETVYAFDLENLPSQEDMQAAINERAQEAVKKIYKYSHSDVFEVITALFREDSSPSVVATGKLFKFMDSINDKEAVDRFRKVGEYVLENSRKSSSNRFFLTKPMKTVKSELSKIMKKHVELNNQRVKLANSFKDARKYYLSKRTVMIDLFEQKFSEYIELCKKETGSTKLDSSWFAYTLHTDEDFQIRFFGYIQDLEILGILSDREIEKASYKTLHI